jgi:hypothetical protein
VGTRSPREETQGTHMWSPQKMPQGNPFKSDEPKTPRKGSENP